MKTIWKVLIGLAAAFVLVFFVAGFVSAIGYPAWNAGSWVAKAPKATSTEVPAVEAPAEVPAVEAPTEAPAVMAVAEVPAVEAPIIGELEAPDERSAASNDNFVGYFGSRGKDWLVPTHVLDTNGQKRAVGSVLYTWCETEINCFYQILMAGDTISAGHQGSQINIYSPEYVGLEPNELQYIQTNINTKWTKVQ